MRNIIVNLYRIFYNIRPTSKPIYNEEFLGEMHISAPEYIDIFEEQSKISTTKLPLEKTNLSHRPTSKPIYNEEFLGEMHMSTAEYIDIFEEQSKISTTKLPLEKTNLSHRPTSKPIYNEEFLGEMHISAPEYIDIFEEQSKISTTKLPLEIGIRSRYIISALKAAFSTLVALSCFMSVAHGYDSLKTAAVIASGGGLFQAHRLKIVTENIANEHSTGSKPGEEPYRRKIILAENKYNKKLKSKIIQTKKIDTDKSAFDIRFEPSHPAADENGYVKYPNIQKEIERADAQEAQRSYEANLGMMEIVNSMRQRTIEAIR